MKKRVGILGGSFDPVHCGHVRIAHSFLTAGLIDTLLILLSPYPPHKQNRKQAPFSHRYEMLKLAFENMEKVEISDLEQKLDKPSYTLHTIEHLQKENPDTLYYLCLGEDSLQYFNEWHKYREILEKVDLLVAERPGFDKSSVEEAILEHAVFVEHEPYPISSTEIRKSKGEIKDHLPGSVAGYIEKKNLYGTDE